MTSNRTKSLAESACELGRAADDLADGVHGRESSEAFLQVNHEAVVSS